MKRTLKLLKPCGGYSFSVVLPKEWVTKNQLSYGDGVRIIEGDKGELILIPLIALGGLQ